MVHGVETNRGGVEPWTQFNVMPYSTLLCGGKRVLKTDLHGLIGNAAMRLKPKIHMNLLDAGCNSIHPASVNNDLTPILIKDALLGCGIHQRWCRTCCACKVAIKQDAVRVAIPDEKPCCRTDAFASCGFKCRTKMPYSMPYQMNTWLPYKMPYCWLDMLLWLMRYKVEIMMP